MDHELSFYITNFLNQIPIAVYIVLFAIFFFWVIRFIVKNVFSVLMFGALIILIILGALTIFRLN